MLFLVWFGVWFICTVPNCGATAVDQIILRFAHDLRSPLLDSFFATVTWGGSLFVLVPVAMYLIAYLAALKRYRAAWFVGLSLVGSSLLTHVGKLIVMRPRPDWLEPFSKMPADHAYPSAHSAQVAALALAAFLVLTHAPSNIGHRRARLLAALSIAMVVAVALSRIYLQVHFPTDVIAGLALGGLWVAGLATLMLERDSGTPYAQ